MAGHLTQPLWDLLYSHPLHKTIQTAKLGFSVNHADYECQQISFMTTIIPKGCFIGSALDS